MSLLTIAQSLALNVGMAAPDTVVGSPEREWQEALRFANETGEELARRVDWGQLRKAATLTGTGATVAHALPADFARLSPGICARAGVNTVRPLTRAEWGALVHVQGVPRYFLLENTAMTLWPYLATAATVAVSYQSKNWTSANGSEFTADAETSLIDEGLFSKGLIVRWRRQKGMPYQDEEAEYEAMLQNLAAFNDRSRL